MFRVECYFLSPIPDSLSDEYRSLVDEYSQGFNISSVEAMVSLIFSEKFVGFASLSENGCIMPALEVYLDKKIVEWDSRNVPDDPLQFALYGVEEGKPTYAYFFPNTEFSSSEDDGFFDDEDKARIIFSAWAEGMTFIDGNYVEWYVRDEETGEYKKKDQFDDSFM